MKNLDDVHNDIWDLKDEVIDGNLSPNHIAKRLLIIYRDLQKLI